MTQHQPQPITTDDDMLTFVGRTMDHAMRDQTWLWLTDADSAGFGTVIQIDHTEADGMVPDQVWQAVVEVASTGVGLVYERRGPESLSAVDQQRLRAALHAAAGRGLLLRGPILVHDTGVRWIGPDDLS